MGSTRKPVNWQTVALMGVFLLTLFNIGPNAMANIGKFLVRTGVAVVCAVKDPSCERMQNATAAKDRGDTAPPAVAPNAAVAPSETVTPALVDRKVDAKSGELEKKLDQKIGASHQKTSRALTAIRRDVEAIQDDLTEVRRLPQPQERTFERNFTLHVPEGCKIDVTAIRSVPGDYVVPVNCREWTFDGFHFVEPAGDGVKP